MSAKKPRRKLQKRTKQKTKKRKLKFQQLTNKVKKIAVDALRVCTQKGTHRPTVAIDFRYRGPGWKRLKKPHHLMIWSVNDGTGENPGIVKGGVEVGEKLFVAAYREPAEEVGMRREHIIFRGYGGTRSVRSLKQKGGFPKKLYIILYADYIGPWKLIVNPNEISRQAWQTDVQIEKTLTELDALRPDKGKVLREALATVLPYLRKKKKEKQ